MNCRQLCFAVFILICGKASAQPADSTGVLPANASLQDCIDYALKNRATIRKAVIDEEIGERDIASSLAAWYPQIGASASYNYNVKIPTAVIGDQVIVMGQKNASAVVLQADQQLVNPKLIQATKAAKIIRELNSQNTEQNKINTVVEVSKAYYDILTTEEQLGIIAANIQRIEKQLADATIRFETGLVDQTDYKRARITLSNSRADEKRTLEILKYKYAYLKELIGLDGRQELTLSFDDQDIETQVLMDTTATLDPNKRIEYQLLSTQKRLQVLNTKYSKFSYLPSLSAFYNYAWDYRNNDFGALYSRGFPRSVFGLSFNFSIFDGNKRLHELRKSELMESRLDWDMLQLKNQINTQYEMALASYNASLNDWITAKENVQLSTDVYDVIKLQYDEGLKTYLDLMTAETDLRTTQINYLNALYAVLSSKLDVQRALGDIAAK